MKPNSHRGARLRFGLVGTGRIAQAYAEAFCRTTNARLVAVTDVRAVAAEEFARKTGAAVFSSHLALAESGKVDAVIVATPPICHGSICIDLLERGIPVLCEKPVSFSVATARKIRQTSRDRHTLFTMASKFRYAEDVVQARRMVASGLVGPVVLFENTFMSFVDMSTRWNADSRIRGGGVLIDNGTHSVDIMRYFIGPLTLIHAVKGPEIQRLAVEETVYVTARSAEGAIGRMDLSWSINKQCDDYISVYGSDGVLRVGWKASYYRKKGASDWFQFGQGYDKVQAFSDQIGNFSAAIQEIEPLVIDSGDAIASVEVIQAGYESLAHDAWTAVKSEGSAVAPSASSTVAA
jgi:predicted dehydrogenase